MHISESFVNEFNRGQRFPHLRWGQQFYEFMRLNKVTNQDDAAWCNKLYNAPDDVAKRMVCAVMVRGE